MPWRNDESILEFYHLNMGGKYLLNGLSEIQIDICIISYGHLNIFGFGYVLPLEIKGRSEIGL